ncbi:hypothetical protein BT69DRAFT_1284064 [Atractiella rhizophila]|nr:hypothetical protein BT69DRAFT_1284064 [Atractiella rhizophila]
MSSMSLKSLRLLLRPQHHPHIDSQQESTMMLTPPPSPPSSAMTSMEGKLLPPSPPRLHLPSPPLSPSPPPSPANAALRVQPSPHRSRQRHETHQFHTHHSFHEKALDLLATLLSRKEEEKVACTSWMGGNELRITVAYSVDEDDKPFPPHARHTFRSLQLLSEEPDSFSDLAKSQILRTPRRLERALLDFQSEDSNGRTLLSHLQAFAHDTNPYLGDVRERRRFLIPTALSPYFAKYNIVRGFERCNMRQWLCVLLDPIERLLSTSSSMFEEEQAEAVLEVFKLMDDDCVRRMWKQLFQIVRTKLPQEFQSMKFDLEETFLRLTVVPRAMSFLQCGWQKDPDFFSSLSKARVLLLKGCKACPEAQLMALYDRGSAEKFECYSTPQYIGRSDAPCRGCKVLKSVLGYAECELSILDESDEEECTPEDGSEAPSWKVPALLRKEIAETVLETLKVERRRSVL